MPGFGKSGYDVEWDIFDYADCVSALIKQMGTVTLVGHSFGGRIALILGNQKSIEKIVLNSTSTDNAAWIVISLRLPFIIRCIEKKMNRLAKA